MLSDRPRIIAYLATAGLIALTTLLKAGVDHLLGVTSGFAFYMVAISIVAWAFGRWPGWFAVLLGGAAINFYFIEPLFSFRIADHTKAVQLMVLMCAAGCIVEVLRFAVSTRKQVRMFSKETARLSQLAAETQARMQVALSVLSEPLAILTAVRDDEKNIIDFRFDYLNEAAQQMNRATRPELGDRTGTLLLETSRHAKSTGVFDEYVKTVTTGEAYHSEIQIQLNERAGIRCFEVHAAKLDDGIVVQWRDTTDRHEANEAIRRSETRFRRLYESNQLGVIFYHVDGRITDPNDAFLNMLGITRETYQADSLSWKELTPPEWSAADQVHWETLKAKGTCGPLEKQFFRRDGSRVPVVMTAANLDPGDYQHGVACVVDLSRTKQVESQLRESQRNLMALAESLEQRVIERTAEADHRSQQLRALALDLAETESRERKRLARLLHDHFQQLISAAKLKAGLVRRGTTEQKLIDSLRQIESLLEEAIAASRSLATELSPPVLSDGGLETALDWLGRKMEKDYGLHVELSCDPSAEPESEQMRTLIFECVRELLFNIVKHAETKEARLKAKLSPEGLLQIFIEDHGKGFDPQTAMRRRMTAGEDGSFGLFSIRERLSLLGGLLNIRSQPGQGTVVELTIPVGLKKAVVGSLDLQSNGHAISDPLLVRPQSGFVVPQYDAANPARVLVADDHRLFREGLINLLSQEPMLKIIGEAADGQEAVDLCGKLRPDILICDVTMPKLNGVQVAKQVSRDFPEIRIIGLSMHEREDMADAMRNAGAVAYITKSGPSDQLLSVIRQVTLNQHLEPL